jgi:hypothetical protein
MSLLTSSILLAASFFGLNLHVTVGTSVGLRPVRIFSGEPGSSVSIVFGYGLGNRGSIPGTGERIFPVASVSRPALGLTQPPVQ